MQESQLGGDKISPYAFLSVAYHYHLGIGLQVKQREALAEDPSQQRKLAKTRSGVLARGVEGSKPSR
eukprot:COSAG01_NODE_10500_length_2150_cov_0.963450_1_plen_67_part_00